MTSQRAPSAGAPRTGRRLWSAGRPVDLAATLGPLHRGRGDPTMQVGAGGLWRATLTPDGPATLRLAVRAGHQVDATAWGPGAGWLLDMVPGLVGADDDPDGFDPVHPLLREAWRRHPGWRVPRSREVIEALVPAVLEQKVSGHEAWRAWRTLVKRYGATAPGPVDLLPAGLFVAPDPGTWRRVPSWEWHRAGVDLSRSRTIVTAAGFSGRLEALSGVPTREAARRLQTLPGVGAWTAAEIGQRALGDADAVSVGDLHLSSMVGLALVGERVDDDAMLELLEPYAGHRYRAVRMIELAGVHEERHRPRHAVRDYRTM